MDDLRIGAVIRTLRLRTRRSQAQFGAAARVSQSAISRFERGHLDSASLEVIRRVFRALDARIDLVPRWRGGELARLVDARHAGLTEALVRRLATLPAQVTRVRYVA